MECPICKKSIKYDKNLIPDEKSRESYISSHWETHFLTNCSHESPTTGVSVATRPHCGAVGCRTILGPSNSFNCPKCHLTVCLSHRVPEDHKCIDATRSRRLIQLATTSGSQGHNHTSLPNSSIIKKTTQPPTKKKVSISNQDQFTNTLKGSAERRKQKESTINKVSGDTAQSFPPPPPPSTTTTTASSKTSLISCPFCAFNSLNSVEMEEHVNVFHLQLFETATSSQSSGALPIPYLAEVLINFLIISMCVYNYGLLFYCCIYAGVPAM